MRALLAVQPFVHVHRAGIVGSHLRRARAVLGVEGERVQHADAPVRFLIGQEAGQEVAERGTAEGHDRDHGRAGGGGRPLHRSALQPAREGAQEGHQGLRALLQERPEALLREANQLGVARRPDGGRSRASGEQADLAHGLTAADLGDHLERTARPLPHHLEPSLQDDVERVRGVAFAEEDLVALEVDPGELALDVAADGVVEGAEDLVLGRAQRGHAPGHQGREDGAEAGLRGHRALEPVAGKPDQPGGRLGAHRRRAPAGQEERSLPHALADPDRADGTGRPLAGLGEDGESPLHHDVESLAHLALAEEHLVRGQGRLDAGGGGGEKRGVRHAVEQLGRAEEGEGAPRQARVSSGSARSRSRRASS